MNSSGCERAPSATVSSPHLSFLNNVQKSGGPLPLDPEVRYHRRLQQKLAEKRRRLQLAKALVPHADKEVRAKQQTKIYDTHRTHIVMHVKVDVGILPTDPLYG